MNKWGTTITLGVILLIILTIYFSDYVGICKIQYSKMRENMQEFSTSNSTNSSNHDELVNSNKLDDQNVKTNLLTKINKNKITLYYSDHCSHCRSFKPEWFAVKNDLHNVLEFNEVNCMEDQITCSSAELDGFPTVYLEKSTGEKIQYTSYPRTAKSLMDFIQLNI